MAIRHVPVYVDDLTEEEVPEIETVPFAVNGVSYEIDLAPKNKEKMLKVLVGYIEKSRRVGVIRGTTRRASNGHASEGAVMAHMDKEQRQALRGWWKTHEKDMNLPPYRENGRVPFKVAEAYNKQ